MSTFLDKCYHVACAIPCAQTVIGVGFAIKDIVGIIKDIAMNTLFKDYADSLTTTLLDLNRIDGLLNKMTEQNNEFFKLGLKSDFRLTSIESMNKIQNSLKNLNLFMPVNEINEQNPLIKTKAFTDAHIEAAILANGRLKNYLKEISFFTETVPATERLYNLATAVISAIPVVGTVYNVGALGYFCFIKS